jgi:hypothetical protein
MVHAGRCTQPVEQDDRIDQIPALQASQRWKLHPTGLVEKIRAMLLHHEPATPLAMRVTQHHIQISAVC